VALHLASDVVVDVEVVTRGAWADAVGLPGLGADLLEGTAIRGAPAFESWLLSQGRRLAAASEAILHEAALGSMSQGAFDTARDCAVRAAAMSPLDENHQALLIRLYRLAGDDDAAQMIHSAALGNKGDADAAALLAVDIDNPVLRQKFSVPATR
jgi:hypothetical protein